MPRAWSRKDERQYEYVEESSRKRGASEEDRAEEIAARTVNPNASLDERTERCSTTWPESAASPTAAR